MNMKLHTTLFSHIQWNKSSFRMQLTRIRQVFTILVFLASLVGVNPTSVDAAPAAQSGTVRFIITGDTRGSDNGVNTAILGEIAAATIAEGADFILLVGDLTNDGTVSQLTTWRTTMQPVYTAGIGVYPVRGNHDASSKANWDSVFTGAYALPGNGPSGEENITFSFTHDNIFVVGLDQYITNKQVNQAWLDAQFAANTQPHVFVYGHEPAFDVVHPGSLSAHPTERNAFWNSIVAEGGRTYFAGHDHVYNHARIDDGDGNPDNDAHQYVTATGGAPLYDWNNSYGGDTGSWTPTLVYHEKQYGYTLVEVDGSDVTLTWKHRTAPGVYEPGGDVFAYSVAPEHENWTAYNDLAWGTGQLNTNITRITSPTGGSGLPSTGNLVDYSTGTATGVTLTVTGGSFDGVAQAGFGAEPAIGTDAYGFFSGKLSGLGQISYQNTAPPDGNLVLTLSGMDASKTYNLVFYSHRDLYSWDRASLVTLSGADGFTNQSSSGLDNNSNPLFSGSSDNSTRLPADNDAGYVARFTGIDPGSDGQVVLTISFDGIIGEQYKGKYASALMLQEVETPTPSHTVTFDANGGTGSMTAQVSNIPTALTLNTFTRAGYTFSGWNTAVNGSGTSYANGAVYPFVADATLYAQWTLPPVNNWTAYNDLAWGTGQLEGNITKITSPTGGTGLPSTGNLKNYSTGAATNVTLTVTGGNFQTANAIQGAEPAIGTDAYGFFNGKLNSLGAISYVDSVSGNLVLTLSGMDASKTYKLVFYSNRNSYSWDRASLVTISGADGFTNESSSGTDNNSNPLFSGPSDNSTRLPALNTATGYVARFTGIDPGSDGQVVLTISFDGITQYLGKYASALMLQEVGAPPPPVENWTAYNDTGFGAGQISTNITTFTSPVGGSGFLSSGELVDHATGLGTGAFLTITGGNYEPGNFTQGSSTMVGDALGVFGGVVDTMGTVSYATDDLVFSFSGLDPAKRYSVVHYANRNATYGWIRAALATITGVDSFENGSTVGVDNNDDPLFDHAGDPSTRYAADFSGTPANAGYVVRFDNIDPGSDGIFTLTMSWDGESGSTYQGKYSNALMLQEVGAPPPPIENWTTYVDLRATSGDSNAANVLELIPTCVYPCTPPPSLFDPNVDWVLKDLATGAALPATMSVDMQVQYATINGADSAASTDTDTLFGGIVDGVGGYEMVASDNDYVTLTFDNLDPSKEYVVAVTYNRDGGSTYTNRVTMFTLSGADSYVNASSAGVVVNSPDSVSFSTGNNTSAGYVAKWTRVTAADGSFSVTAEQDASFGGSKGYAMTSIMLQEYDYTPPPENWVAYNDLAAPNNTTPSGNFTVITTSGGTNTGLPHNGELVDFATGAGTGVTLVVTGGEFNGASHTVQYPAGQSGEPAPGTEAYAVFNGKVNALGSISYVDLPSPAGDLVLAFSGMDPAKTYTLVFYGHRDNYAWDRASLSTLSDVDGFTNESSVATDNPYETGGVLFTGGGDASTYLPSDNDNGYVVRYTGIHPGSDGDMLLTISPGVTGENRGKYANALMLEEEQSGVPALPSSFYGEIHISDNPPEAGDTVEAYMPDVSGPVAITTINEFGETLVYTLNVPAGAKGAAAEGDTITFKINGRIVATAIWHSGTNVELNFYTHSLTLVAGWNLISFNVHPADTDIAAVLASIDGNYDLVYAWDASGASSTSGNWVKYAPPPAPSYQNTLLTLDETMGFWIYMTAADTLDLVGSDPTTTDIALLDNVGGWNLVGYPSAVERSLPGVLSDHGVGADFTLVYAYHAYDVTDPWKLFDRMGESYANDLSDLAPGWAYWILVIADHTWSVQFTAD